jgi:ABC-type branched-subunit amino acid transport system substrate-binding protein
MIWLARFGLGLVAACSMLAWLPACASDSDGLLDIQRIKHGERIYRDGVLANGLPLTGSRSGGVRVLGASAACITCHRASGMGGAEGNQLIPPVTGALLRAPGLRPSVNGARAGRMVAGMSRSEHPAYTRAAYTAQSFAEALVNGHRPSGAALDYLMPRYALDAASLAQLMAYLDTLKVGQAPGVDDTALHLATIVTADAPAAQRNATLDIMSRCLAERSPAPSGQAGALRPWQHHVWQLGADPAQWPQELAQHQRRQSVFAVVSGISGNAWSPIHQFCEREKMPCVLPNTTAVDDRQASHWSFYFSRGASLEAAALAERLADEMPAGVWRRIVQRTDGSEAAQLAADALQRHLRELGIQADIDQQIHDPHNDALLGASITGRDALVLWLNPTALRQFTATAAAPRAGRVIFSGELGGLDEAPVAQAWRERAWMLYPYEAAGRRNARIELNTGHWMARQGLELQPALSRLQGNTYSACEVSVRALQTMRERYSRAYFVELLEAADEAAVATAYPRFTLGPAQRHGSRGAFIMQYQAPDFTRLTPTGDWIVPSH